MEKLTKEEAYRRVSNLITAMNPSDPRGLVRNVHGVIDEYAEAIRATTYPSTSISFRVRLLV